MTSATDEHEGRPLGLTLLTGLYFFFFLLTFSTIGHPFPLMGRIYQADVSHYLVLADSLVTLYLFLGIMKRQYFTWHLLLAYNLFEILNIVVNLNFIDMEALEKVTGAQIPREALMTNNIACALALLLLTQFIYRHKAYFTNRTKFLF
jgi:hypothetical protein